MDRCFRLRQMGFSILAKSAKFQYIQSKYFSFMTMIESNEFFLVYNTNALFSVEYEFYLLPSLVHCSISDYLDHLGSKCFNRMF